MRVIKGTAYIFILLFFTGCVERYYPGADEVFTGTLVINASLINIPGIQTIQISRSDGLLYPEFIPESSCVVEVENQVGVQLSFSESTPGYYSADVPEKFMRFGDQYMLRVVTSEGYIYSFDRVLRPLPDSLDDRQCWITGHVNAIYTLDAANMTSPSYTYMPLHFVSNETQRLSYGYSLLVRQHAMDAPAFRYWDELKKNSHTQSGLYDRLPSITPSNISNVDDPEERILGFFGVSGVTEKRLFVKEVEGLRKYDVRFCFPYPELPRFRYLMTADLPVYCSRVHDPETGIFIFGETVHECLDCRVRKGSSGDPPDYWPIE